MDLPLPSDLTSHLRNLIDSIDADGDTLTDSLEALAVHLRTAVSSYLGLRLTLVLDGWPVTLTAFSIVDGVRPTASLRMVLASQGPGFDPDSQVVFYAGTPGAFVDMAADIDYLHRQSLSPPDGEEQRPAVALDIDLPPVTLVSGFIGLTEYSTINRAIGTLIDDGRDLEQARAALHRRAAASGLALHLYAAQLLGG